MASTAAGSSRSKRGGRTRSDRKRGRARTTALGGQSLEHRILLTATNVPAGLRRGDGLQRVLSATTLLQGRGNGKAAYLIRYLVYGTMGLIVMEGAGARRRGQSPPDLPPAPSAAFALLFRACAGPCTSHMSAPSASTAPSAGSRPPQFQFQPSELMKLALVLLLRQRFLAKRLRSGSTILSRIWPNRC